MPELDIKLYAEGFNDHDKLGRAELGKQLSELVEKIDEPLVIALNSSWGNGKTHFLKCWVGAHRVENDGKATTIYFDAFKHDYLDDPLIALTSAIIDRLDKTDDKTTNVIKTIKKHLPFLTKASVRIGAAIATAGGSEIVGTVGDAALNSVNNEFDKATEEFWKKEDGKRAAMAGFEQALIDLTKDKDGKGQKLVIVIDELDRCRPDYALSMLETIKHFFQIPNVQFILGVNLHELKNSVRARYGSGVNADVYLQKFINIVLELPENTGSQNSEVALLEYFSHVCNKLNIPNNLTDDCYYLLEGIGKVESLSLRSIERLVGELVLTPNKLVHANLGFRVLYNCIKILKLTAPILFQKYQERNLQLSDVQLFFKFDENEHSGQIQTYIWATLLEPNKKFTTNFGDSIFDNYGRIREPIQIYRVLDRYLNTFSLSE